MKRFLCLFFGSVLVLSAAIIALNAIVDPWRFYRDSTLARFDSDARQQTPGIIRQKQFEAIVIGTSLDQNFDPVAIEEQCGLSALVAAISAGTAREQALTVSLALEKSSLRRVFWGIHPSAFARSAMDVKSDSFPAYLYDDHRINDIFYLFNASNIAKSFDDLKDHLLGKPDKNGDSWRNLHSWGDEATYGCPDVLERQIRKRGLPHVRDDLVIRDEEIDENVRKNLGVVIREHPRVGFTVYFPPMSKLYWSLIRRDQPRRYAAFLQVRRTIIKELTDVDNVEIYDFADIDAAGDLDNYKDLTHCRPEINQWMLEQMTSGGIGRVNRSGLPERGSVMDRWLAGYDVDVEITGCLGN